MSNRTRIASRLALAALASTALAGPARAQEVTCDNTSDFPCSYQIRDVKLQKVPSVFKFQSRVSQAKLPLGEGVFNTVYVKLLRGTEVKCVEQFQNVQVVDSVLNLEIGRNMSCEMDEVIAENTDLAFQICPGGQENCLQPVSLGAAPYAIKASFASIAQSADHANQAGQASYAHRATADRDLLLRNRVGTGYFDFYTPAAGSAVELYSDPADYEDYENSGFLQWTPVRDRDALDLHIVGKREGTDQMTELRSLHLASEDTTATGDLTVTPSVGGKGLTVTLEGVHVTGDSDLDGTFTVTMATTIKSGGVHVTGNSDVAGTLAITQRTTVAAGGIGVTGNSDINGTLGVSQKLTVAAGGAAINGLITGTGGFDLQGDGRLHGELTTDDLAVTGSVTMSDGQAAAHRVMAMSGSDLVVNPDTSNGTRVNGSVRFTGPVIFEGGTSDPSSADTFILAQGESRDIRFGGSFEVLSAASFPGGIAGDVAFAGLVSALDGLSVTGPATFQGPVTLQGGVSGNLALTGGVQASGASTFATTTTSGAATFNGAASFPGGIAGAVTMSGALTLGAGIAGNLTVGADLNVNGRSQMTGDSTFTGKATFNGPAVFNGSITLGGAFAGLTTFDSIAVNGNATFSGAASFPGGVASLDADIVKVGSAITVDGATTLKGPVTFQGAVNGLVLNDYVKATGETRALTLPGLVVTGGSTFQGNVAFPGGLSSLTVGTMSVQTGLTVTGNTTINGDLRINGAIAAKCRLCLNYADTNGSSGRKHACVRLEHGAFSGIFQMAGDVDDNDVMSLKFLCDDGPNSSGPEWL